MQAGLQAMPRCSLSYAKIMQTESRDASWLASYAEVQLILCKDNANREQRCKLACKLCRGAAYLMQRYKKHEITTTFKQETCRNLTFFSRLRQVLMISAFFLPFYFFTFPPPSPPAGMNERRLIVPTATTKMRQLPQQKRANCHNKNAPTATIGNKNNKV